MRIPFLSRRPAPRVMVLGLDGVPYSFLLARIADGSMPNLAALAASGSFLRAESVQPTVSCVAWACYMTGQNPGRHGIYGFQDLRPGTYQSYIPNGLAVRGNTLWETLSEAGKRVIVMNVPMTYPPREVNGLLVGDFLAPKLEGATWPPELAGRLAAWDYKIDVDPWLARESLDRFYEDLMRVHASRRAAFVGLVREEKWDFAQCHIMGTDRINHFLWGHYAAGDPQWTPRFMAYYAEIDAMIGECLSLLGPRDRLFLLSDHGFCSIKQEVNMNVWLREQGLLVEPESDKPKFDYLDLRTSVFSMTPGRFYINHRDRFPLGSVDDAQAEALLERLEAELPAIKDPHDGSQVIEKTYRREQLYEGPAAMNAPDLVAVPYDGYDLKGTLGQQEMFSRGTLVGMHTFGDAFWLSHNFALGEDLPSITDGAPTVLALMGLELPGDMDGVSRLG